MATPEQGSAAENQTGVILGRSPDSIDALVANGMSQISAYLLDPSAFEASSVKPQVAESAPTSDFATTGMRPNGPKYVHRGPLRPDWPNPLELDDVQPGLRLVAHNFLSKVKPDQTIDRTYSSTRNWLVMSEPYVIKNYLGEDVTYVDAKEVDDHETDKRDPDLDAKVQKVAIAARWGIIPDEEGLYGQATYVEQYHDEESLKKSISYLAREYQ